MLRHQVSLKHSPRHADPAAMATLFFLLVLFGFASPLVAIGYLGTRSIFQMYARSFPEGSPGQGDALRFERWFRSLAKWTAIMGGPVLLVGIVGLSITQ